MSLSDLTQSAVELAIAEYDQIGPERFLEKYGFGKARKYFLFVGDREYHSKAIAGAAHGYIPGQPRPLRSIDFSGGENTVADGGGPAAGGSWRGSTAGPCRRLLPAESTMALY